MKIGVMSDTHLYRTDQAQQLAERLLSGPFAEVDAVLHAGDAIIRDLETYFYPLPWYAVRGNMDHALVDVPVGRVVTFCNKNIGMVHGWGSGHDIERNVLNYFSGYDLSAIIYGHSHLPSRHRVGSILLFNPGSPTQRRKAPAHTVGILTIEEDREIAAEIIVLD